MFIFVYQIITKPLTSRILSEETCPACNKNGDLQLTLYIRYIALGIPFFGMGRHTGVTCTNCENVLKNPYASIFAKFAKKKYSNTVAAAIKNIRANHKRTLWQLLYPWSIWFVLPFIILIMYGFVSLSKHTANERAKKYAELINHPQPGDIYKAMWSEENSISQGALVKLMRINGDTMYVVRSKEMIPMSFAEEEWNKLSADAGAFNSKEYKVMKFADLKNGNFGDFFMYNKDEKGKQYPIYLGGILNSKSEMDLDFETIERKK